MTELSKRVFFALVAAPVFIYLLFLGGIPFWLLITVLSLLTTWEITELFKHGNYSVNLIYALLLNGALMSQFLHPYGWISITFLGLLIIISETLTGKHEQYISILTTLFSAGYAAWGFYSFYQIRTWGNDQNGFNLILLILLMIWGNDSLAYFGGRAFGKHKLAPAISPGKTWEGFFSGFLGSLLVFGVYFYFLSSKLSFGFTELILLAFIVSIFGPIGDLSESKIKRLVGKKDSSNLLPGHGGLFDRFDSILLVSPAVVLYLNLLETF